MNYDVYLILGKIIVIYYIITFLLMSNNIILIFYISINVYYMVRRMLYGIPDFHINIVSNYIIIR
jgi:hypothetical protein